MDQFNAILVRQLSSVQRGTKVWQKCIDTLDEQAALLTEVGVDFSDLIKRGLVEMDNNGFGDTELGEPGDAEGQ